MREAFGCGFYPGPDQHRRSNKTDYGNAVWQRFDHPHPGEWQYRKTHDNKAQANASKLRQGDHAPGVDGKLLTELLGKRPIRLNLCQYMLPKRLDRLYVSMEPSSRHEV